MDQLFLIPASRAPLRRIFLGGKDVLLAYANGKARVWNVETCEFRRSTGLDAGEDMLQSGDWAELYVNPSCQKCSDRVRAAASWKKVDSALSRRYQLLSRSYLKLRI